MVQYIIRRILAVIPVLFGVSILVFSFIHLIPGDPCSTMLGERATPAKCAEVNAELGLDKPLYEQYIGYMGRVLHGDLGTSIIRHDPITEQLKLRFPATVELSLAAMIFAVVLGVPAGVVAATRRNSIFDNGSMIAALTGVSMPIFWLGLMLSWLFGAHLHWLPTGSRLSTGIDLATRTHLVILDSLLTGNSIALQDGLRHLLLPAIVLGTIPLAIVARMTRSAMLEVLGQDYVRTARAKGQIERRVIINHALRNALLPVVTIVGLQVGLLLAGAILTETIFSWPGIGLWAYQAILDRDYPIVQGVTLFVATLFVVINLAVDISYAFLDPRIRLG